MEAWIEKDFSGNRNRVFPPYKGAERLEVMKDFGFRGLMWDRLIRFPVS